LCPHHQRWSQCTTTASSLLLPGAYTRGLSQTRSPSSSRSLGLASLVMRSTSARMRPSSTAFRCYAIGYAFASSNAKTGTRRQPLRRGGGSLAATWTTTTRMTATSTDGTPAWTDAMTIRADLVYAGSLTPMMMLHVLVGDARPPSCRDSASPSAPSGVRLSPSNGLWSDPARWSGPPHHKRNRPYPQHTLPDTRPARSPCHSCWTTQSTLGHQRPISPRRRTYG